MNDFCRNKRDVSFNDFELNVFLNAKFAYEIFTRVFVFVYSISTILNI